MKRVKQITSIALTITLLMTSMQLNAKEIRVFGDVDEGIWYEKDLYYIQEDSREILNGYPDSTFRPNNLLTVEQFIKCVVLATRQKVT